MKSPIDLLQLILTECGNRCRVSTHLDFNQIKKRYEDEGFSFLAITLATYGKDFTKALDQGSISPDLFLSFKKRAGFPELFRGFLENIFASRGGRLLSSPCVECIRSIRQITLMWAKVNLPSTSAREIAALTRYKEGEFDVHCHVDRTFKSDLRGQDLLHEFRLMSRLLFSQALSSVDQFGYTEGIVPTHGPGSTADSLRGNAKWSLKQWTDRLEGIFPFGQYALPRWGFLLDKDGEPRADIVHRDPGTELPVKVICVPKTLDKPRIIAMEPTCMMFIQQGIHRLIQDKFRQKYIDGNRNFAYDFVCYDSQLPNQQLARKGSYLGTLATLDLSDASDSVSNLLVKELLGDYRWLREAVAASRSSRADVRGEIITLSKFASMGSALCFPMEAMVFATVVFLGIQKCFNRPLTKKDIKSFIGHVRVYGDDIVVPVEFTQSVVSTLKTFGFKVNVHKSFWNGKFRESCGKDYYDGHDISIVRLRNVIPQQRRHIDALVSFVSFRNHLFENGYFETCEEVDKWIMNLIPFPAAPKDTEGLTRLTHDRIIPDRMCPNLQRPMVKAVVAIPKRRKDPLSGEGALLKFFTNREISKVENPDVENLRYAGRPVAVDIKHRWIYI